MKIFFELIFILKIIVSIESSCNITHPILKNEKCESIYCTNEQFNSSECKINNLIVKTQWLTSLIPISDINFRYISPVFTKNDDLIIQTTKSTGSPERNFFGIRKNGRYYFNDSNGEEYPYFTVNATNGNGDTTTTQLSMLQNVGSIIYLENDDSDYFLSIGAYDTSYSEIIDFKRKTLSRVLTSTLYYVKITSETGSIFEMTRIGNKKYYVISFITLDYSNYYFMIKLYTFNKTDIGRGSTRVIHKYQQATSKKSTCCFEAPPSNYIFCFFQDNYYRFTIHVYDPTLSLTKLFGKEFDSASYVAGNENLFMKALHLIQNAGFYIYYKTISNTYPTIQIKEWNGGSLLNDFNSFGTIKLDKYNFNSNLHLNDVIKLGTNQICFSSTSPEKEILYIVIFNFYENFSKFVIRYYTIKLYELYNKKILFDLKLIKYNDYLSLSTSLCSSSDCSTNDDEHYSYLIIFSYPNSTDIHFDLINHLLTTNDTISNLSINFFNSIKIENNIFGYNLNGIKILSIPEKINIKSKLDGKEIYQNDTLTDNEDILVSILLEDPDISQEYIIEYALTVSEPDYNNINDYTTDIDNRYGDENERDFYNSSECVGKTSFLKIIKNASLSAICQNEECSLCYKDNKNICITCRNEYVNLNDNKICRTPITTLPIQTTIPIISTNIMMDKDTSSLISESFTNKNIPIDTTLVNGDKSYVRVETTISEKIMTTEIILSNITESIKKGECSNEEILLNQCNKKITNEQIGDIYEELKNNYLNSNYTNENIIILTDNVAFQISTLEDQKNMDNPLISNIEIRECEQLLKNQENLTAKDQLIILKTDIKSEDFQTTYVQYEIYNPLTKKKINLSVCQNVSISINSPVILSSNIENLYDSLNKSGFNLFNSNDPFYNDICSPYTSESGKDIPMADRRSEIYSNVNNNLCQNNCTFIYYNSKNKKANCDCKVQVEETEVDTNKINFKKEIVQTFFTTLTNSNFLVLKCYKLVFSMKGQTGNSGSYIMIVMTITFMFLMFIYSVF